MKLKDLLGIDSAFMRSAKIHFAYPAPDGSNPINEFLSGSFEEWQSYQSKRNFERKHIISLISLGQDEWLFAGIYERLDCIWLKEQKCYKYKTELKAIGDDLVGRVVVRHRKTGRQPYMYGESCCDGLEVLEIRRNRYSIAPFPGFESTRIEFELLRAIVRNQDPSWKSALSSVKGVYLVADKSNGRLYVGSAYGEENLWQRWAAYALDGHGNNVELRKAIEANGTKYALNFVFSILEIRKNTADLKEIIERESYWKDVLLTREYGYNRN
jgi:hypothetical protein